MFDAFTKLNWLAVLVADVAGFGLGAVWYTVLFKHAYAASLGREHQADAKPSPLSIAGLFLCNTMVAITTALLLRMFGLTSFTSALGFAAIVGVGYLVCTTVNVAINPNFPRPFLYGLVSGSYFFVANLVMTTILVAMA